MTDNSIWLEDHECNGKHISITTIITRAYIDEKS